MDITVIIEEIESTVERWESKLLTLEKEVITGRTNRQNRNIKQIIGHLIDSASNNIHRVVHLQYQPDPLLFPNYASEGNNDRWIAIQNYTDEYWFNMVMLWKFSMLHYCHIIRYINAEKYDNKWISGPASTLSLREMVADFPRHLKLHMAEIEELLG